MDVYIREDVTVDEFIDVLIGNRRYVNCIYLYNKIDTISMEEVDRLARQPSTVVCSVNMELNLDGLKKAIWEVSESTYTLFSLFTSFITPKHFAELKHECRRFFFFNSNSLKPATRSSPDIHKTKRKSSRFKRSNRSEARRYNRRCSKRNS